MYRLIVLLVFVACANDPSLGAEQHSEAVARSRGDHVAGETPEFSGYDALYGPEHRCPPGVTVLAVHEVTTARGRKVVATNFSEGGACTPASLRARVEIGERVHELGDAAFIHGLIANEEEVEVRYSAAGTCRVKSFDAIGAEAGSETECAQ